MKANGLSHNVDIIKIKVKQAALKPSLNFPVVGVTLFIKVLGSFYAITCLFINEAKYLVDCLSCTINFLGMFHCNNWQISK